MRNRYSRTISAFILTLLAVPILLFAQGWRGQVNGVSIFSGTVARPLTTGAALGTTTYRWNVFTGATNSAGSLLFSPDNTYDIGASGATRPRDIYVGRNLLTGADASSNVYINSTRINSPSDGVLQLLNNAGTDFVRLQLGGITSAFPSLKRTTTSIDFRLADDSAYANTRTSTAQVAQLTNLNNGVMFFNGTAPTISSGFGTSPSVVNSNGTVAFTINVGTGGTASSGVIGLSAATTGWNCFASDQSTPGTNVTKQTATATTTATLTNYNSTTGVAAAWTASDILKVSCFAY